MSETIAQTNARIAAFVQENAPTLDISPGSVFNELLISTEAQVQNYVKNDVLTLSAAQTIASALASSTDTYNSIIDGIASNYNITRNTGTQSTGIVRVTVSSSNVYTVPTGTQFIQPLLGFIYSSTSVVAPTLSAQTLVSNGVGGYYFDVPVQAVTSGLTTAVTTGAAFQLVASSSIPYFISAQAHGAFVAGQTQETDKQLIARMRAGMSVKNFTSSDSIASQLQAAYPGFQSVYLADFNDPLNLRASNNPLQLKLPGCVDVYSRNSISLTSLSFTVPSGSTTMTDNGTTYTLAIIPDSVVNLCHGFYRVVSVQVNDPAGPSNSVVSVPYVTTYGITSSTAQNVQTAAEARLSIYQTASIVATYTKQGSVEPTFTVTVLLPQNLYNIQSLLNNSATRLPNADYLVKGVVPCIVTVNLSLLTQDASTFVANSKAALQADIFNYINSLAIGQPIAVSQIVKLCHNYPVLQVRLPVGLSGTILLPYYRDSSGNILNVDQNYTLNGTDTLSIPNLTQYGVNASNTAFFTNYFSTSEQENINITVS